MSKDKTCVGVFLGIFGCALVVGCMRLDPVILITGTIGVGTFGAGAWLVGIDSY